MTNRATGLCWIPSWRGRTHEHRPLGHLYRPPLREPVPAGVRAADRVRSNILRAFEAGWGGVVTKTIGLHPVANVAGPRTKFTRYHPETAALSMNKGRAGVLHSSWNWELISDKPLDWWVPRIERIKKAFPDRVLIASIMAGSGSDRELDRWRSSRPRARTPGADGLELNLSCPHMDRPDMGSNIGKDQALCSIVTQVVKQAAGSRSGQSSRPQPATSSSKRARSSAAAAMRSCHRTRSHRFRSSIPIRLEFEMNVDGRVSSGGLGGPAILPQSLALMSQMTRAFPERASPASAASRSSDTPSITSCSGAARSRCAPRPCSTTRSGRTSSRAS